MVFPMFAWPGPEVTFTDRLAPLALLVCACVDAVNVGLNRRLVQPPTLNGVETSALAPCVEVMAEPQ